VALCVFCGQKNKDAGKGIHKEMLSIWAEMDVLRRSARKSRMERMKNEQIKEMMGLKEKPVIIDIIQRKRLQWYEYGHVKRMQEERITKLIMDRVPRERRKRGHTRKT
jgi:hypothetical protein